MKRPQLFPVFRATRFLILFCLIASLTLAAGAPKSRRKSPARRTTPARRTVAVRRFVPVPRASVRNASLSIPRLPRPNEPIVRGGPWTSPLMPIRLRAISSTARTCDPPGGGRRSRSLQRLGRGGRSAYRAHPQHGQSEGRAGLGLPALLHDQGFGGARRPEREGDRSRPAICGWAA